MDLGLLGQAVGMFAVTNIDDLVILAVFFGQCRQRRGAEARVVVGQYLGFAAILATSVVGAFGADLLPDRVVPYLGLVPLALGVRAGWTAWRDRRGAAAGGEPIADAGPTVLAVAAVTFANGGDNIGVYVPVFASAGDGGLVVFTVVFLVLTGIWCAFGRFLATRPASARALSRWGHLVLPAVLIGIGALILVDGGAFGL
ncbi:cadmium resistance transporter [Kutzneria sp. CA-103260]|uniref:cadmium resistance transporter n=1 Tax=Kutzneria sp. CA-103260 TaxID=2802641 RepID=UPI001BAD7DDF|nr:cadmium resistance transporter [Kutzneria sp. CA-103260]QUQ64043.1 cadmium transporter [Kutzneria sp. CA-103260]